MSHYAEHISLVLIEAKMFMTGIFGATPPSKAGKLCHISVTQNIGWPNSIPSCLFNKQLLSKVNQNVNLTELQFTSISVKIVIGTSFLSY